MNYYQNFKNFIETNSTGFDFGDAENEKFLSNIVNYFAGGESTYDINKGLLIRGSVGAGKTATINTPIFLKWDPISES